MARQTMTQAAIASCSQSTPLPACNRTPSGMNISTSRVRLRAITADATSGPPLRSITRRPTMRLPGVAPRQASSK